MKNINTVHWNIDEANKQLERNLEEEYWKFLIKQINYHEISFDDKKKEIVFASYVPIKDVVAEVLNEIEEGFVEVSGCCLCKKYFNINNEDGIFGDPGNLKHFICNKCSKNISAKDFYENHLKM